MTDPPADPRPSDAPSPDAASDREALAISRRRLIMDSLGIAVSAVGFGFVYGLAARQAGFSPIEAVAMSTIVFAGAAGIRLGSGLIITRGQSRLASLRREGARSLPIVGVSVILFILAAFLEGFVSASPLPYWSKASIALFSTALLAFYLFGLGRTPRMREGLMTLD